MYKPVLIPAITVSIGTAPLAGCTVHDQREGGYKVLKDTFGKTLEVQLKGGDDAGQSS